MQPNSARAVAKDLWREMVDDRVGNGAAALAFYMVLALFPGAIFGLSVLPYLPVPHLQQAVTDLVRQALPGAAADVLVKSVSSSGHPAVLSLALVFAIWSASSGLAGIMQQLNVVFEVREHRSFVRIRLLAAALACSFFALVAGSLVLAVFGGELQSYIGDHLGWSKTLLASFATLRWVVVVSALHCSFTLIYYFGPNMTQRFTFFTPGSVVATVALLLASVAFKAYVAHFSSFDVLYGGLGAVMVLLIWLFVAGWVILLGAEINDVLLPNRQHAETLGTGRATSPARSSR
ncbi:MAG: YihY/virulence factor BrkB family protein [Polyangiaceae bacterium]